MMIKVTIFGFAMTVFGAVMLLTAFVMHLGRILELAVSSFGGGCAVMGILLLIGAWKLKDD